MSSAVARTASLAPSTWRTPSRAEPSSAASTSMRSFWPGVTARTNRSSSPAGSSRPLRTTGAAARTAGRPGRPARGARAVGRRPSAAATRRRAPARPAWPGRGAWFVARKAKTFRSGIAFRVAAATFRSGRVPPRSSKPTVSPRRPPSGKTSSATGTAPTSEAIDGAASPLIPRVGQLDHVVGVLGEGRRQAGVGQQPRRVVGRGDEGPSGRRQADRGVDPRADPGALGIDDDPLPLLAREPEVIDVDCPPPAPRRPPGSGSPGPSRTCCSPPSRRPAGAGRRRRGRGWRARRRS